MFSLGVAGMACGADALAEGFADPPAESRPRTWWHWMDNNISRAGITKDLEAMGPTSKIRSDLILEVFVAFPLASPCARRAEDVAPYHVCAAGPTSKIRSDLILEVFRKLTAKHLAFFKGIE